MVEYYGIQLVITDPDNVPAALFIQYHKNELSLSPNGRLCDMWKMAHLDSVQLAEQFRDAYLPRLRKRYGNEVETNITKCSSSGSSAQKRIIEDSAVVRKRIETGILAANVKP